MTYEKLSNISLLVRKRQEKNKDALCVSTGEKGDGKSNYSMVQARDYVLKFGLICRDCQHEFIYMDAAIYANRRGATAYKRELFQPCTKCQSRNVGRIKRFSFDRWLAYDAEELEELIYSLPRYSPVISDELARFALAENWNSVESKSMKRLLIQCRTKNLFILGNIPDFITLDKKYRNMADYWVRLLQRDNNSALAVFSKRSKGEHGDKFHIVKFQELLGDYFEDTPMDEIQRIASKLVQKHPCVEDSFIIPPLNQDEYDAYEIFRNAKVFSRDQADEILDEKKMTKVFVYNLLNNWGALLEEVKAGRYERPTLKMVENYLARNPITGKPLLRYTTIRNYQKDIEAMVKISGVMPLGKQMGGEIKDEVKSPSVAAVGDLNNP